MDPFSLAPNTRLTGMWIWQTGGLFLEAYIRRQILASIPQTKFDLVYVDGGELVGPSLIRELKLRFGTVINYNLDDPFGPRDGRRWRLYLAAIPFYDLIVVVRDRNVAEAYAAGASNVLRVERSADEIAHSPRQLTEQDRSKWACDVAFVGTWMPERGPFIARLIKLGVPLSIYGDRWHRAREYSILRPFLRGKALYDDNYAKLIQSAKVSLGLLSKGNRDLSTQRSFEIPYLGGVLCAERTEEHMQLYCEDEEAMFWSTPEECARKCEMLLDDGDLREQVARKGQERCIRNRTTNQQVLARVLERLSSLSGSGDSNWQNTKSQGQPNSSQVAINVGCGSTLIGAVGRRGHRGSC